MSLTLSPVTPGSLTASTHSNGSVTLSQVGQFTAANYGDGVYGSGLYGTPTGTGLPVLTLSIALPGGLTLS